MPTTPTWRRWSFPAVLDPSLTNAYTAAVSTVPYDVAGPTAGPAIVLIHSTRLTRAMWRPQIEALSDEFRVLAVDLPGHGALAEGTFGLEAAADHVADVIETALGRPAVVVGLSLGGYVGMALAARRPEIVRALVLSGATAEPVGRRAIPYRSLAWAMGRLDGPRLHGLNERFFRSRYGPEVADAIVAGGFWSQGGAGALRAITGERFLPRLAAYPGPTLIINGEYDLLFRLTSAAFAASAKDARRVRLRGATHLANLDRPEAFTTAVRRFVRSLPDRA